MYSERGAGVDPALTHRGVHAPAQHAKSGVEREWALRILEAENIIVGVHLLVYVLRSPIAGRGQYQLTAQ
eukprot:SAG11_NODE_176_length_13359_cov_10.862142_6_plen_70_part_00